MMDTNHWAYRQGVEVASEADQKRSRIERGLMAFGLTWAVDSESAYNTRQWIAGFDSVLPPINRGNHNDRAWLSFLSDVRLLWSGPATDPGERPLLLDEAWQKYTRRPLPDDLQVHFLGAVIRPDGIYPQQTWRVADDVAWATIFDFSLGEFRHFLYRLYD